MNYRSGLNSKAHIGGPRAEFSRSIKNFSSPCESRMDTFPLASPKAKYWPSWFHEQQLIRVFILNFCIDFWPEVQNKKSLTAQLARTLVTGLNARHWTASLCLQSEIFLELLYKWVRNWGADSTYEYFSIASSFEVQIIKSLSAPPEANFVPSRQ